MKDLTIERVRELREFAKKLIEVFQQRAWTQEEGRGIDDLLALLDEPPERLAQAQKETKAGATASIKGYPQSVKQALTPSPGLSPEDERALERLTGKIASATEYPDRALLYQDIEYLRSRLQQPAPLPKEVEEAIAWLGNLENMNYPYCRIVDDNEEIIATIKAALINVNSGQGVQYEPAPSEVCDYCHKPGLTMADDGKLYHDECIARLMKSPPPIEVKP